MIPIPRTVRNRARTESRSRRWRNVSIRTDDAVLKDELLRRISTEPMQPYELELLRQKMKLLYIPVCFAPEGADDFTWEHFREWLDDSGFALQWFEGELWIFPVTVPLDKRAIQRIYDHLLTYSGKESLQLQLNARRRPRNKVKNKGDQLGVIRERTRQIRE